MCLWAHQSSTCVSHSKGHGAATTPQAGLADLELEHTVMKSTCQAEFTIAARVLPPYSTAWPPSMSGCDCLLKCLRVA